MAIFVSNPTSNAVSSVPTDGLEPVTMGPETGFTEELAAAMHPPADLVEAAVSATSDKLDASDKKLADLQILPAEVLLNAVGDANFALSAQSALKLEAAKAALNQSVQDEAQALNEENSAALDLANHLQGAELAAANLAAQQAAQLAAQQPSVSISASSGSLDATSLGTQGISPITDSSLQASQAVPLDALASRQEASSSTGVATASLQTSMAKLQDTASSFSESTKLDASNAAQASLDPSTNPSAESQSANLAIGSAQSQQISPEQANNLENLASASAASLSLESKTSKLQKTQQTLKNDSANELTTSALNPDLENHQTSGVMQTAADSALEKTDQFANSLANPAAASNPANAAAISKSLANSSNATRNAVSASADALSSTQNTTEVVIKAASDHVDLNTNAASNAHVNEESAFNFDAKLASTVSDPQAKALNTKAMSLGTATQSSLAAQASTAQNNLQPTGSNASNLDGLASRLESVAQQTSLSANATFSVQEEASPAAVKSLDELSSTFVSSLVGGPQRPVTTVMDWVSLQSQERPSPVLPHEVRLDSGAVQMEIQKMVRQGGGHVVMELTPPDQSKFTIELKLDERGNALLIVEGVSDSTKTRLEQSAPQLREQFQQMGLELQLDMRQQGQSASSNAANFADAQERGSGNNNLASNGAGDMPKVLTQREAGVNRARETGSNQVYLYA